MNLTLTDGSVVTLTTRERPKLLLDPDTLHPVGLYNGARSDHGTGKGGKGGLGFDWTFTLYQPIRRARTSRRVSPRHRQYKLRRHRSNTNCYFNAIFSKWCADA